MLPARGAGTAQNLRHQMRLPPGRGTSAAQSQRPGAAQSQRPSAAQSQGHQCSVESETQCSTDSEALAQHCRRDGARRKSVRRSYRSAGDSALSALEEATAAASGRRAVSGRRAPSGRREPKWEICTNLVSFLYKSSIPYVRGISKSGYGITSVYGEPSTSR